MSEQVISYMRREEFSLPEGPIMITWPLPMSEESASEVLQWLDLLRRKVEKCAAPRFPNEGR